VQLKEALLLFFYDLLLTGTNLKDVCSNVTANVYNGDLKKHSF
jgi:hypothetical protein